MLTPHLLSRLTRSTPDPGPGHKRSDGWLVALGVAGLLAAMAAANLWWALVSGGL